ncbi:MAG: ABC transporter substrate-binding protein [Oscillospiraceae bacterium]|nr:ABC transporter substrate-binding protein [Oscillospiraceae bacterium]
MKKFLTALLALAMIFSLCACGQAAAPAAAPAPAAEAPAEPAAEAPAEAADPEAAYFDELIAAAKAEGELVVYGSCEDPYIAAACDTFQAKYGITTSWQRLTGGEVQAKAQEEAGNPSADVWVGGTSDPQAVCASQGLLEKYDAKNAVNLIADKYKDADGYWYGIYTGVMGFFYDMEALEEMGLEPPQDWADLIKPEYNDAVIWFSNPNTASTAKLFLNTTVQMWGEEKAEEYWVEFDKNIDQYTKSGGGPSKNVGPGECNIGIGFLHDAIYQIANNGYDNIGMSVPTSGTSAEVGAVSIFAGAKHPNAAKLFIEFCLTPECVERAAETGSFQFLVLKDAKQPEVIEKFGLTLDACIDYDFADAKEHTTERVERFFEVIGANADDRFKTE